MDPTPAPIGTFNGLTGAGVRVKIVDIGANPLDGTPPYEVMLRSGDADIVGFEPNPEALAELNTKKGPTETYLPYAVGDGRRHTLHFCQAPGMTSLLEPALLIVTGLIIGTLVVAMYLPIFHLGDAISGMG